MLATYYISLIFRLKQSKKEILSIRGRGGAILFQPVNDDVEMVDDSSSLVN